ncbi:DUF4179 domain-containing protein [Paenibacillus provencensis]|uniref:DUF4179 domain-containing protein n=1 Tax=Paenibacillus provencensis TaxID=441151 RepID=A0ABW3PNF2_9BACL|nr:DUF4179 domain-containing protein [Paenibacillus sp. MER 78]MCM3127021.1 DUF4179 domain-containing protein [Paenibacillus sp. MER 78]
MRTIEERLQEHKQTSERMLAPSELEDRLRNALDRVPNKKKKNEVVLWFGLTAAALVLIVGTYQYPALTYYGNELFNMGLNASSFSEAATEGYGQEVNKSTTLDDGTLITVDRVIADDNSFSMYYTIKAPEGEIIRRDSSRFGVDHIEGFMTNSSPEEGSNDYSEDETVLHGIQRFESVSPLSRTLTVTFYEFQKNGERETYPISFKFDTSKAMKSLVKEKISKSVAVDQGEIYYESITASLTSTVIKGHIKMDEEWAQERQPWFFGTTLLYVNGIEMNFDFMESQYDAATGLSEFELGFDALPTDEIRSLELILKNSSGYHNQQETISLVSPSDQSIKMGSEKLWIRSVSKTDTGYDIVMATKQFTILENDNIFVQAGGTEVPVSSISSERPWDLNNGNILWERTYSFNTTDQPESLILGGYHYIKTYNKIVPIPFD